MVTERFATGERIVREGEPGDRLYILAKGRVEVTAEGAAGRSRPLAELRDGDYFGEVALLRHTPRMASVRALAPTSALVLARQPFLTLLEASPASGLRLRRRWRLVATRAWASMPVCRRTAGRLRRRLACPADTRGSRRSRVCVLGPRWRLGLGSGVRSQKRGISSTCRGLKNGGKR